MNNYEIADHFLLLSKLMDIHGENSFKSKSYSSTAFNIERLPAEISTMDDAILFSHRGIGESTGKKIRELLTTSRLSQLDDLVAATPPGIIQMLDIKGLGPKKIAVIWKELGIESLGELEYACNENRLVALKGFGAKTQESILESIVYFNQNLGFHLWAEVETFANNLLLRLRQQHPDKLFALTGAFRRQNEIVEFVELVTTLDAQSLTDEFGSFSDATIEKGEGSFIVRIPGQPRIRFYIADTADFYNILFRTSGTDEFVKSFLDAYSIPDAPSSEEAIFTDNGLGYIDPIHREYHGSRDRAKKGLYKDIIQPSDIKGIIHSHSTWSDGVHTIEQMAKAARDQGLEYLVISDHSQSAFYAGGLKPEQIAAQHQEVDALNDKLAPFKIFKSIESDILSDGNLDYNSQVLNTFDLVIGSVHSNLKMTEDKAMDRLLTAVRNPYLAILGHPTGRLLLSRKGYPLDHKKLIDTCAEHRVVIEINAHPRRLDIDWRWIEYALEKGVLLSINPDAHSTDGFKDTYYGVMVAQKGGLTAHHNLSSFTLAQFEDFLKDYRSKRLLVR